MIKEPEPGYPVTFDSTLVNGASRQAEVFEPALCHFPRAFRMGDPEFSDAGTADAWYGARRSVVRRLLEIVSASQWESNLVLRGSLLLKTWLPDAAREPGDVDWVVTPQGVDMHSAQARELIRDLIERIEDHPRTGLAKIDARRITQDEIWTYDRVPGLRLVLPWSTNGAPSGSAQIDFVFNELLPTHPILAQVPVAAGRTVPIWTVDRPLALAWKLLWLESDAHPQGKDLYDAVILAEQTHLPFALLRRIFDGDEYLRKSSIPSDLPMRWHVDWENFRQEYPWVQGGVEDWKARLTRALAGTLPPV